MSDPSVATKLFDDAQRQLTSDCRIELSREFQAMATRANAKIWTREEALAMLRELLPDLKARYGVTRIGIFGSVARNEARPGSDMDVVVHLENQTLDNYLALKSALSDRFDLDVDIVFFRESMRPRFRDRLERESVYA